MNREYEIILICGPNRSDSELQTELGKLQTIVAEHGGSIQGVEDWGKKELPYVVRGEKFGVFKCMYVETAQPEMLEAIRHQLRISSVFIKFQVHRLDLPGRGYQGNPLNLDRDESSSEAA